MEIPNYLSNYSDLYKSQPREANLQWFREANYGLFLHYGLYSSLGRHEWVQFKEKIRVKKYEKYINNFTAEGFDADAFVELAIEAGMKYINITSRHHESFCLWDTKFTDFNSINAPANRDLIKELYEACQRKGIGLFLYYSHGIDWRHPHSLPNKGLIRVSRPHYFPREKHYAQGKEHDLNKYVQFMYNQVKELLTLFPNVAGIWLDGITIPYHSGHEKFKVQELYDMIHSISPHALVCYKMGLLGTEDFFTSEINLPTTKSSNFKQGKIIEMPEKKVEVCTIMTIKPKSWGYYEGAEHRTVENVVQLYKDVTRKNANLLLNTGPLPDGSIDPIDNEVLREAGKIIKNL
jgi:alpha-L-fucosidase